MDLEVADQVMDLYADVDRKIEQFQADTQLQCPSGCGWCCQSPEVETTPLEMLPLVLELFRRGEADTWMSRAQTAHFQGSCVFYQPDPTLANQGRCQVYLWRPTLCRLFGFAAVLDKQGQPQLATCIKHKEHSPEQVQGAEGAIAQGTAHPPNFAEITQQVTGLDPTLGQHQLPINEALAVAIERVGLYFQMTAEQALTPE